MIICLAGHMMNIWLWHIFWQPACTGYAWCVSCSCLFNDIM